MAELKKVLDVIEDLCKDASLSKNVRNVFEEIRVIISGEDKDTDIKIDTALQEIEALSLDPNLSAHTRTQIWNLTSILESANNGH